MKKPKDLPRNELLEMAQKWKQEHPASEIFFKFTCEECGERNTFSKPNVLYERATCYHCKKEQAVTKGGFLVQFMFGFNHDDKGAGGEPD